MAMHETANARRPVTLVGELARLAAAVNTANQLANRAESISGSLTGHFPVAGGSDEPSPEGYFFTLRNLIDGLIENQDRIAYALNRMDESLTDEVPAQSKYAEETGRGDYAKVRTL